MLAQTASSGSATLWIVVAAVIVVLAVILARVLSARRRGQSAELREQFGDKEYERTLKRSGSQAKGERELAARRERVSKFNIVDLKSDARRQYENQWRDVQAKFVDSPTIAIGEADRLVESVMRDRGYPVSDFEQQAADLTVDHPRVVDNYRVAHAIALRNRKGASDTEALRQAMVHYRTLFEDLLG